VFGAVLAPGLLIFVIAALPAPACHSMPSVLRLTLTAAFLFLLALSSFFNGRWRANEGWWTVLCFLYLFVLLCLKHFSPFAQSCIAAFSYPAWGLARQWGAQAATSGGSTGGKDS
jgi:hypothetical protein